uniref:HELP domain-containing protein n=1 Tax=Rhabditophanes sp. KR3021 TaxID=114890 RepID=A0AC35TX92_9BILA
MNYNLRPTTLKNGSHGIKVDKEDHTSHTISSPDAFEECVQYDVKSYRCQLDFSTKCFHKMANHVIVNSTIKSDQRVGKDGHILVAQYKHTKSVLDMKSNKTKDIVESFDKSQKSVGFYFPAGSSHKANELINDEGYYKFCDYQVSESNNNSYEKTQNECIDTTISQKSEFLHSKFCSSHNFVAVVIYAQIGNKIKWELYWKIWPTTFRYIYTSQETSLHDTIFLSCEERNILFYASTNTTVYLYPVGIGSW